MTAHELQRIALRLGNQGWCRHWLYWNHPNSPAQMAIQVIDHDPAQPNGFGPVPLFSLKTLGFREEATSNAKHFYVIDRTNDDGMPFVSTL